MLCCRCVWEFHIIVVLFKNTILETYIQVYKEVLNHVTSHEVTQIVASIHCWLESITS